MISRITSLLSRVIPPSSRIAVGLSGGPDSVALCLLLREWCSQNDCELHAITVDHGIREESTREALQMRDWCHELGVPHTIKRVSVTTAVNKVMDDAQKKRYAAMRDHCAARRIPFVLTGHQLDDQTETLLMRLARSSSVDGLAGMRAVRPLGGGVVLVRPLLEVTKEELEGYCQEQGVAPIYDPTNHNTLYFRARARATMGVLKAKDPAIMDHFRVTLHRLGELRRAKEAEVAAFVAREDVVVDGAAGVGLLPLQPLTDAREPGLRLFGHCAAALSTTKRPPKRTVIAAAWDKVSQPPPPGARLPAVAYVGDVAVVGPPCGGARRLLLVRRLPQDRHVRRRLLRGEQWDSFVRGRRAAAPATTM